MLIKLSFTNDGRMVGKLAPSPQLPYGRTFVEVIDPVTSTRLTEMANSRKLQQYIQAAAPITGSYEEEVIAFSQFQPEIEASLEWKTSRPRAIIRGYRLLRPGYGSNMYAAQEIYSTNTYINQLLMLRELYIPHRVLGCGRRGRWLFAWDTSLLSRNRSRRGPINFNSCYSINAYGHMV